MTQRLLTVRAPSGKSVRLPVEVDELARAPFTMNDVDRQSGLSLVLDRDGFNLVSLPHKEPTVWPSWMARQLVIALNRENQDKLIDSRRIVPVG